MCSFLRLLPVFTVISTIVCAQPFSVTVTRFGTCLVASDCQVTFTGTGTITFSGTVGELPDGIFSFSGTATETDMGPAVLLTLTDLTVQGLLGGITSPPAIPGGIELVSGSPIVSPDSVAGFAALNGQLQTNTGGGLIAYDELNLRTQVDGATVGFVDTGAVTGVSSPVPFNLFNSVTNLVSGPFDNLLIGTYNFDIAAGDGFFLPTSGQSFATPIPEPSTFLLLGPVLIGTGLLGAFRSRHNARCERGVR